jgi:hypothetical protein
MQQERRTRRRRTPRAVHTLCLSDADRRALSPLSATVALFAAVAVASIGCGGSLTLTGIVADDYGIPVDGATVAVKAIDDTEAAIAFGSIEVVTNSYGEYSAPGLTTGNYEITSYQTGYADAGPHEKLVASQATTEDLTLRKRLDMRAVVYAADGAPAAQATVLITREDGITEDRTTDGAGKFSVGTFYRGDTFDVTIALGRQVLALSDQRVDSDDELTFELPEETLRRGPADGNVRDDLTQDPNPTVDNP